MLAAGYSDLNAKLDFAFSRCASHINEERKSGEVELKLLQQLPGYPIALLSYLQMSPNPERKLRAAIEVKLWLGNYSKLEQFQAEQFYPVVDQLKPVLVPLLVQQPKMIADQLSEAIVNLASVDFPVRWPSLMLELIAKAKQSSVNINRVVMLMTSLTFKYTYSMRSDPLYSEIIKVCDQLHNFLFEAIESVLQIIGSDNYHKDVVFVALKHLMRLFYNLNYQDLHPLFEDNLNRWMEKLIQVIHLAEKDVRILKAKSEALKSILLFASKYRDDIRPVIENFSQQIWRLCSDTIGSKQDEEVVNEIQIVALKYFKHLIVWPDMKQFFANNLESLLQILILPNIGFNHAVAMLLQEDQATFIGNYFENSEVDSRRSTAIELLRSICRSYKFDDYLKKYLAAYCQQPQNLTTQCTLLNLVIDAGTVAYRNVDGVTSLGVAEDIIQFCYLQLVKNFFQKVYGWVLGNDGKPIESEFQPAHLAIYLRYVYYFRLYLPKEDIELIAKFCCSLRSESVGLRNIVLMVLEAFIDIRFGDYTMYSNMVHYFDKVKLDALAFDTLKLIYCYEQKETQLNKQLTRLMFIVARRLEEKCVGYTEHFMAIIKAMLGKTDSYDFKSVVFVFEALGVLTFYTVETKVDVRPIETVLDAYFKKVMQQGSDLLNFVFQLYGLILRRGSPSTNYLTMYQSMLGGNNWIATNSSIFSAYIQYIVSFLTVNPSSILSDKTKIEIILSKLIEMKEYNHFYSLLWGILEVTKLDGFFNSGYLSILLTGTTASIPTDPNEKRPALIKQIVLFFCRMIVQLDPVKLISYTNQISGCFVQLLLVMHGLPIISMIQFREERKMVFQGISTLIRLNLLSSLERWAMMLNALVENTNRRTSRNSNVEMLQTTTDSSFQKLWIFKKLEPERFQLEKDEQKFLVESFGQVFASLKGKVNMAQLLPQSSQQQLSRLITKYNTP